MVRDYKCAGLLAARQLSGRRLLPGNPVVMSVLGRDRVFCVVGTLGTEGAVSDATARFRSSTRLTYGHKSKHGRTGPL